MALYKISSSRVNNIDADQYSGSINEQGLIWYDPETGVLRLYNGEPGGQILFGNGGPSDLDLSAVDQDIIPAIDNTYNIGSPDKRWKELYVSVGSIHIGDLVLSNKDGTLLVGEPITQDIDPHTIIRGEKNVNDYASLSLRNTNNGDKASTDILLYNGPNPEVDHYLDIGVASDTYNYPGFEIIQPKDTYVIGAGGGHIKIGTDSAAADVVFFAGGVDSTDYKVARFAANQGLILEQGGVTFTDGTSMFSSAGVFGLVMEGGGAAGIPNNFVIDGGGAYE